MKKITNEEIDKILQVMYQTNIPVAQFDALRKMLLELPLIEEKKEDK